MSRTKRNRKMDLPPPMIGYKPFGIPFTKLGYIDLLFEEYEAIRLADYLDLNQEAAAVRMGISRPTFTRIYDKARKTIAKALTEGKIIYIKGGSVKFEKEWFRCNECDETFDKEDIAEPESCNSCNSDDITSLAENQTNTQHKHEDKKYCYCLNCDIKVDHIKGTPCRNIICPKCKKPMTGTARNN